MTNSKTKIRHASLFSGIGAAEAAADALGWENVFHCEINPFGRKVLAYWFPESESHEDIRKTDFTKYRGRIDVVSGGFPCQPFSAAGKRKGAGDDRYLWPEMFRAIGEIRPAWVVGENVAGITSMVEQFRTFDLGGSASLFCEMDGVRRYGRKGTFTVERICSDLEGIGYSVQPVVIPAAAVGAPHLRYRVFLLAYAIENVRRERTDTPGGFVAPPDPDRERLQKPLQRGRDAEERRKNERRHALESAYDAWEKGTGFDDFPSVSPIHSGDDGLPFRLADLAISATKWRKEAIKACGNAIVVPVIYEIFRAIEQVENGL